MNQLAFALEQPIVRVRQIAGDLSHQNPTFVEMPANSDAARRQLDEMGQQKALEPFGVKPPR